ncbi:MAG: SprT-like domain-containing protein [Planctomycetes bacterium]|nr:SprT-like domain-containing protein [Planctomycetota bacterium]
MDDLPSPEDLQRRCAELFAAWRVLDTDVEVRWNARLSTTAGRAYVRRGCIELNPRLLAKVPDEIDAVLVHEAAHVAAFRLFGANIPAHGRHWRSLMRHAGCEPNVTHKLPVDDLRRRPRRAAYLYLRLCGACGDRVVVERVRYGRCPGCSRRDDYLVVRTRASAAGRRALLRMSDADVRAHFA